MRESALSGWRWVLVCALATAATSAGIQAAEPGPPNPSSQTVKEAALPVLRTAEQIHLLTREEAARAQHAVIRGVVTCSLPDFEAAVIQDSTRGIYIDGLSPTLCEPPRMGELLEVEGVTDPGEFAPRLHAVRITRLGTGELPAPVQPTWDQLINGSLDTQFVEIQGIVTSVGAGGVTLLTHGGKIKAELFGMSSGTNGDALKRYENSLIRLRCCLFASWDPATHQVRVGEVRIFTLSVTVDEPAPVDVFAVTPKRAPDLLLFDPQASALRRAKVFGQIVHKREGEYYMMDVTNGLRFVPKEAASLEIGDLVEVAGFPSLTGPSPVLREAVARKVGVSTLPKARALNAENLFRA